MANVIPKDECCRYCQTYTYFCLTIYEYPEFNNPSIISPIIGCKCRTTLTSPPDTTNHCIGDYGVYYNDPTLPPSQPTSSISTEKCFSIEKEITPV